MEKVKRLTLDRYEHGLLVRALYELWKEQTRESGQADALGDLILKVIDAPAKKTFGRWRVGTGYRNHDPCTKRNRSGHLEAADRAFRSSDRTADT